jgi:hypothetical protein
MVRKFDKPRSINEALTLITHSPVVKVSRYTVGNHRVVTTHQFVKSPFGLRLVVTGYKESNQISIRLVKGDGRRKDFWSMCLNNSPFYGIAER